MTEERLERLAGQMLTRLLTATPNGDLPTLARQAVQSARALAEALDEKADRRLVVVATHLAATEAVPVPTCPEPKQSAGETLGQRVRRLRQRNNWSQRFLAEQAGVSKSSVVRIEGGEDLTMPVIGKIADALEVTQDHLLYGAD